VTGVQTCALPIYYGVGVDHKSWFEAEKGPIGLDVLRAVRRELDPEGVLNPGKLTG